jgi:hypothetical protein
VVHDSGGGDGRRARRRALNAFADLALPDIAAGFHLRPIVIPAAEASSEPIVWQVSPHLARRIRADGLLIT